MPHRYAVALSVVLAAAGSAYAQENTPRLSAIQAHVLQPEIVEPTPERIKALKTPENFKVEVFADGLINPRMLAVAEDGTVYVTRRSVGDVVMLRDTDGDGKADTRQTVANRPQAHGIAIYNDALYLVTVADVYRAVINEDGTLQPLERIVSDLPAAGQHPNRVLKFGPDGMMYLSVGSTCNACPESDQEHATLLRISPDGVYRTIFASGLRNTIGYDWHPETGELWGMDHGTDWLGDKEQPEELNLIEDYQNYGWPYLHSDGQAMPHREPPAGLTHTQWRDVSKPMVMGYAAHAAPMQMLFYRGGQFPKDYQGDAFITMRGSWNAKPATGYEIVRLRFKDGKPQGFEPFIRGFLENPGSEKPTAFARPVGLAFLPDGSMLFTDDANGVIYRVSYDGPDRGEEQRVADTSPPSSPVREGAERAQAAQGEQTGQLATQMLTAKGGGQLGVSSPAFAPGREIPLQNTAYDEDISPALNWSPGPEGTKSYAIIMEDPDAGMAEPFVHWIAYNIPAEMTALREALPAAPKLKEPNLLQGTNTAGRTGYYGPKPPDYAPHRYVFQVFALDRELDIGPIPTKRAVLDAMNGHVLAKGELMGTFTNPAAQQPMPMTAAREQPEAWQFEEQQGFADGEGYQLQQGYQAPPMQQGAQRQPFGQQAMPQQQGFPPYQGRQAFQQPYQQQQPAYQQPFQQQPYWQGPGFGGQFQPQQGFQQPYQGRAQTYQPPIGQGGPQPSQPFYGQPGPQAYQPPRLSSQ